MLAAVLGAFATAQRTEPWQAVLPAIMELPIDRRHTLLDCLGREFDSVGVDIEPFEQTAVQH